MTFPHQKPNLSLTRVEHGSNASHRLGAEDVQPLMPMNEENQRFFTNEPIAIGK